MIFRQAAAALAVAAWTAPAAAQAPALPPIEGTLLRVTAHGSVTRVPDIVVVHASVRTEAPEPAEAIQANRAAMARLRETLRAAGVAEGDMRTSSVELRPLYRNVAGQTPELTGYRAGHRLAISFRDAGRSTQLLDVLARAGVTDIDGPRFEFSDSAAVDDEARRNAAAQARARADLYAEAFGLRVHRVVSIEDEGYGFAGGAAAPDDDRSVSTMSNVLAGGSTRGMSVTVLFELR